MGLIGAGHAAERIAAAPPGYLLAHGPSDIARHGVLLSPRPAVGEARVVITPGPQSGEWRLDIAGRDRPGLLAAFSGVLAGVGIEVAQAVLATWEDGAALQAFLVRAPVAPDGRDLQRRFEASLDQPQSAPPVTDADIVFDAVPSPLYTPCQVRAADRPGLLHAIAVAIAAAGGDVHAARDRTEGGMVRDDFDLSDRRGHKLGPEARAAIGRAIIEGVGVDRAHHRAASGLRP